MSNLLLDLVNPLIAPTPAREARVGVIVLVAVVALASWRLDQLWLQILLPAAVAVLYIMRMIISAKRAKNHRQVR